MSTATSIATRDAAEAAVRNAVVVPIPSVEYNSETFRKFSRSTTSAVPALPSPIGGGSHGHIFLLEDVAAYTVHTGGTGYTKTVHPGAIDFTGATTNAQIARIKETRATDFETYSAQEGARASLRKLIVANVPAKILVELKDADSALDEVEPQRLPETIKERTAPVTCLDAMALKTACDALLTFDTSDPHATQFAVIKKKIADLWCIHGIVTSESEIMMMWLLEIEKEKDFEDQVEE